MNSTHVVKTPAKYGRKRSANGKIPPLVAGDVMSRDEFLRRWEAMPDLKFAELIGGVVYLRPPLSMEHAVDDTCTRPRACVKIWR